MKVYALQGNVCETPYQSYIRLFGVFDNMELAKKKAIELGLPIYLITEIEMSKNGKTKAYALETNVYEEPCISGIRSFGVFGSKKLAKKKAKELGLSTYLISEIEINKPIEEYIGSDTK